MKALAVVSISLVILAILCRFHPARQWWTSFRASPGTTLVLALAMTAPFLGGQRDFGGETALESASGTRLARVLVLLSLLLISAAGILRASESQRHPGAAAWWMVVYAVLAMVSAIYSVSPFVSFWKGFEVFVLAMTGLYFATQLRSMADIRGVLDSLWLILLFLVLTALVGAMVVPEQAFAKLEVSSAIVIQGVYPVINSNTLTQFAALLFVLCIVFILQPNSRSKGWAIYVLLAIATATMLMAHSRTSIFAGAVATIVALHFLGRRKLVLATIVVGPLAWLFSEALIRFIGRGQSKDAFMSLSGRTHFWETVWDRFLEAPLVGHGFYAAQRSLFGVSSVDNTYLEVLLGLGIVGLVVFVTPVLITGVGLIRLRPRDPMTSGDTEIWLQLMVLFVLLFVRSLTGPSFQVMHWNLTMLMVLLASCAALQRTGRSGNHSVRAGFRRRVIAPSLMR